MNNWLRSTCVLAVFAGSLTIVSAAPPSGAAGPDLTVGLKKSDIEFAACRAWVDGKEAEGDFRNAILATLGLAAGDPWTAFPAGKDPKVIQYLVVLKRPVKFGSLLFQKQGTLRYLKPGAALPPDPAKADNWVEVRFPPRHSGWRLATVAGESQAFLCTTTYSWDEWHPFRFLRLMKPRLHNIVPEAIANGEAEYTSYGDLRPPEYFKASFIVTGEGSWQSHGPDRDGRTPRPPVTDIDPTWFVVSWDEPTTSTSISMTNSPPKSPFPHGPHNHSQRTVMNLSRFTCLPTMKISR